VPSMSHCDSHNQPPHEEGRAVCGFRKHLGPDPGLVTRELLLRVIESSCQHLRQYRSVGGRHGGLWVGEGWGTA